MVRVHQLRRYCIENYLLDERVVYDVVKENAGKPPQSRGELESDIRALVSDELRQICMREVVLRLVEITKELVFEDLVGASSADVGSASEAKIINAIARLQDLQTTRWASSVPSEIENLYRSKEQEFFANWKILCSGKRLLEALKRRYETHLSSLKFKTLLAERLAAQNSPDWTALKTELDPLTRR
jgi:hypothetical protein